MKENNLITNINKILKKKGWIDIPSSGVSMYPLIKEGDVCRFVSVNGEMKFKKGEIILYITDEGQLVGHRYIYSFIQNEVPYYVLKGDTNVFWDHPIEDSQIIGKLDYIKKRKILIRTQGHVSRLWGGIAITLPLIPRLCKRYLSLQRRIKFSIRNV